MMNEHVRELTVVSSWGEGLQTVSEFDFDGLRIHFEAWDRLAWAAPQAIPTLLPAWIETAFRFQLAANERWFCSFAYRNGDLVGVLPVVVAPHPVFGRSAPLLRTPYHDLTPTGDVLLKPGDADAAFEALLTEVRAVSPNHLGIDLRAIPGTSPLWGALHTARKHYGSFAGRTYFYSKVDTEDGEKVYFSGLGNLRRNLKRYRKKLEHRGAVSVELKSGAEAGKAFLEEFLTLEASGWKGRNASAILNLPSHRSFFETLVDRFAARGRLEWHLIRVADRVVVAEMGFRCGPSLMLPKIAFDEAFSDCMPGGLLTGEVIRDAFERPDIAELNHMSDEPWHRSWRMRSEAHGTVHLVRRSPAAVLLRLPAVAARSFFHTQVRFRVAPLVRLVRQAMRDRARALRGRAKGAPGTDKP